MKNLQVFLIVRDMGVKKLVEDFVKIVMNLKSRKEKNKMKPLRVYIAGPYSLPDPGINVHNAVWVAEEVRKKGHIPYLPHLTHLWHLISPHFIEYWYALDLDWLEVCDVMLVLAGESQGVKKEIAFAKVKGIRVVHSIGELEEWVA